MDGKRRDWWRGDPDFAQCPPKLRFLSTLRSWITMDDGCKRKRVFLALQVLLWMADSRLCDVVQLSEDRTMFPCVLKVLKWSVFPGVLGSRTAM